MNELNLLVKSEYHFEDKLTSNVFVEWDVNQDQVLNITDIYYIIESD